MAEVEKPKWIYKIADDDGLERIHQSVVQAEKNTSAEIVPMIVRSSSGHGHVPWVIFLIFLLVAWAALPWVVMQSPWQADNLVWDIGTFLFAVVMTLLLSRLEFCQRYLIPAKDRVVAVDRRAVHEFHHSRISATEHATGVLIFVSLLEKRAVVLADRAVNEKFSNDENVWAPVIEELIAKVRNGDFAGGMCAAIARIGEKLQVVLPIQADDKNEVDDLLVVKD